MSSLSDSPGGRPCRRFVHAVEAQIWTVIGLLAATLIGTLVYFGRPDRELGNKGRRTFGRPILGGSSSVRSDRWSFEQDGWAKRSH
ncbi:MAG: hypothetical protein QOH48_830 [Actinomycetota bacterium]|nr:hypothetical protein [Actinomycetota bacterium]